jgi:hypothetical protein
MKVKYFDLKKWDKAQHWSELLEFVKIDWMYAQWRTEKGELKIGHSMYYELKDWIYYPADEAEWDKEEEAKEEVSNNETKNDMPQCKVQED